MGKKNFLALRLVARELSGNCILGCADRAAQAAFGRLPAKRNRRQVTADQSSAEAGPKNS